MRFKEWLLKEVGTTTGDIAAFRRISIPMTRRMWPPPVSTMFEQDPPGKKKVKQQPQVQESLDISKYDPKQIKMGLEVEQEHNRGDVDVVDSKEDLMKIVIAHLREDPKYYSKLKKIEDH